MSDRIVHDLPIGDVGSTVRLLAASGPWGFSNNADRAIRTATIAYCHTQNRIAGNGHSGWPRTHIRMTAGTFRIRSGWTRTHIRTTADMSRIRIHSYRSTRADTRADVPYDERPQRSLQ
jgi:hypothetical protein